MIWEEFYNKYIKQAFPKLRPSQAEILSRIPDDARLVVIAAPTGVGKSLIGLIRGIAESGVYPQPESKIGPGGPHVYIVTPTKGLQDQYKDTLQRIYMYRNWSYMVLKGRQNYSCPLLGGRYTAANCPVLNVWSSGRRFCPYKPRRVEDISKYDVPDYVRTADGFYLIPPEGRWCPYWLDKYESLRSHFVVFNYHYYFQELFYVGDFPAPDVVIFDEVHTAFNVLESLLHLHIRPSTLQRWGIELPGFYRNPLAFANALRSEMYSRLEEIEAQLDKIGEDEMGEEERDYFRHYVNLYNEIYESLIKLGFFLRYGSYFFTRLKIREGGFDLYMRPYPVFLAYVINRILFPRGAEDTNFSALVIAMSATPGTETFWSRIAHLAGLHPNEITYINYEKSPFPVGNRLIFIPTDAPEITEKNLRRELGQLYDYADRVELLTPSTLFRSPIIRSQAFLVERLYEMFGRVLVHTWNNKLAFLLTAALEQRGVPVVLPRMRPTEQIQEWAMSDEDSVLVTAAAKEGVDLAYDRARVQVILKLPIPNQRDPYAKMLKRRFPEFYKYQIASALVQQAGRVVRARDDWGYTIIYDSNVRRFIYNHPSYFPRYFREAVVTRFSTEQVLDYLAEDYLKRRAVVRVP